jgi:hypothetical protein
MVVSVDGERIYFDLHPSGQVITRWDAFHPGSGYASQPQSPEEWLEAVARYLDASGELWICLGRWHGLSAGAVSDLRCWLDALDCPAAIGPRSRLSVLALRA